MCIVCIPSFVEFDPIEKGWSFEWDHLIQCRGEIGNVFFQSVSPVRFVFQTLFNLILFRRVDLSS